MRILITGAKGKLGCELVKVFPGAITTSHEECELSNLSEVTKLIDDAQPNVVIHAAAKTGIPPCENNKKDAWLSNVVATENLYRAVLRANPFCRFIYISTPCVFDGSGGQEEEGLRNPQNYYGFTKTLGEVIIETSLLKKAFIVRTNIVPYAPWPHPKAFSDRYSNYLFMSDFAQALKEFLETDPERGIYHILGSKIISMYDLAMKCPDSSEVQKYTLKEYYGEDPSRAKLTKDMSLKSTKLKTYDLGFSLPKCDPETKVCRR